MGTESHSLGCLLHSLWRTHRLVAIGKDEVWITFSAWGKWKTDKRQHSLYPSPDSELNVRRP
jgi:hypothetical protein